MATATLVNNDIDIGRRIIAALTRASIPVKVYLWAFIPQLQEWQFMIATPLVDTKGPLAAYTEVNRVLQKAGVFEDAPHRRIFLRSPNDRVLKSLEKESRGVPQEAFRVVNEQIAGSFVEDAYVYSGSLDVLRSQAVRRGGDYQYLVIYMPYSGPGGAVPTVRLDGAEELRDFLERKVSIRREVVDRVLQEIAKDGDSTIPNVQLKHSELKRLGLA
jgi:hypothetical protein